MLAKKNVYLGLAIISVALLLSGIFYYFQQSQKKNLIPEIKIAYGKVNKLTESSLTLENETFVDPDNDSLASEGSSLKIKNFFIDSRTKFYRYQSQPLPVEEYNAIVADFNRKIDDLTSSNQGVAGLEPPSRFPLQLISSREIKIGEEVEAYSLKNKEADTSAPLSKVVVKQSAASVVDPSKQSPRETINGTVEDLLSKKLVLLVTNVEQDASTSIKSRREVQLNGTEKFFKMRLRSQNDVLQEQTEFIKKINQLEKEGKSTVGLNPPALYDKQQAELTELVKGQKVSVTLTYDGDKISMIEIIAIR